MLKNKIEGIENKKRLEIWKAYVKLMDEGTYLETELASYLLTATQLKNPTLFMRSNYIKEGFEEAEEKDALDERVKFLKTNESRPERIGGEIIAIKEKKKTETDLAIQYDSLGQDMKAKEAEEAKKVKQVKEEEGVLKRNNKLKLKLKKKKKKMEKEILVDEVDMARKAEIIKQQELLTKFFMESIASAIERKVEYLGLSDCYGSSTGSLTQSDHDICLMMSSPEKFKLYNDSAVNLITFENVYKVWHDRLQKEFDFPLSN